MSVYKREGQPTYSYDFRYRGHRFSGSTGCTTERAAKKFEADLKLKIKSSTADLSKPISVMTATTLWWEQCGQFLANKDDAERNLEWLQKHFGNSTLISTISDADVARAVAKRRGEDVANSTVNRTMTMPLRSILRRAKKVWGQTVQEIDWPSHVLPEPQERIREASKSEEASLMAEVRSDYAAPLKFAILSGCRRAEIIGLKQRDIDWFNKRLLVLGKGDRSRYIPMTGEIRDLLWPLRTGNPEDPVFTYVCSRPQEGQVKGERYPITKEGFKTEWRRTRGRAEVQDFRFHDTRHTAATRLVRATGNLKLAQKLLGHADIATTARYAHVTDDDLRAGMEAASATQSATEPAAENAKVLEDKANEG